MTSDDKRIVVTDPRQLVRDIPERVPHVQILSQYRADRSDQHCGANAGDGPTRAKLDHPAHEQTIPELLHTGVIDADVTLHGRGLNLTSA